MRLISASGSVDMQEALSHRHVMTLVDIMVQVRDQNYFRLIAQFIKQHEQRTSPRFEQDLLLLGNYYRRKSGQAGLITAPQFVDLLQQTLLKIYQQPEKKIRYQRGAIVELLVRRLVCPRYRIGECISNGRFLDERGKNITDQVDIAVLSHDQYQVEGYECKIKAAGIASEDCTNLMALRIAAEEQGYDANVGIASFDNDYLLMRRLDHFESLSYIQPYGLDSLQSLQNNPFQHS